MPPRPPKPKGSNHNQITAIPYFPPNSKSSLLSHLIPLFSPPPLSLSSSPMAVAHSQAILCMTSARESSASQRRESPPTRIQSADPSLDSNKIVLQPRVCTLRTYGPDSTTRDVLIREDPSSPFFASLADYVANSRKSQDFEIISGRLAMLVFAGALGVELVTGDSLFKKVEVKEIAEAVGVCLAVVGCSAAFAWVSIERTNIGRILSLGCNSFVDSLVDNLVDGLFFDNDPNDWSDDM